MTLLIVREDYQTNAVNQIFHICNRPAVHLSSHPVATVLLFTRTKIHDQENLDHRISGSLYPNTVFFQNVDRRLLPVFEPFFHRSANYHKILTVICIYV